MEKTNNKFVFYDTPMFIGSVFCLQKKGFMCMMQIEKGFYMAFSHSE